MKLIQLARIKRGLKPKLVAIKPPIIIANASERKVAASVKLHSVASLFLSRWIENNEFFLVIQ